MSKLLLITAASLILTAYLVIYNYQTDIELLKNDYLKYNSEKLLSDKCQTAKCYIGKLDGSYFSYWMTNIDTVMSHSSDKELIKAKNRLYTTYVEENITKSFIEWFIDNMNDA